MTNHVWSFSVAQVRQRLKLRELRVLNDFTALALSVPQLAPSELRQVGGGVPVAGNPIAVIGPGTGLGVSGLIPAGDRYIPLHSEGGHVTYGAASVRESRLLAIIGRRFGHVSAERLVSGPGLVNVYQALGELTGATVEPLSPAEISRRALQGDCAICRDALDTFCSILGTAAGNLVLTLGARAGVYIGGGIVPKLGDYFAQSPFRAAFEHRGRFSRYLAAVPSYVIHAQDPALRGAAQAFDRPPAEIGLFAGE
ncbi:glucokinase [Alkalilimnicola ehrlichii]|nr:glucokinase [Alkalilimnicola ehrlichii]